jgi:hypothetical protein
LGEKDTNSGLDIPKRLRAVFLGPGLSAENIVAVLQKGGQFLALAVEEYEYSKPSGSVTASIPQELEEFHAFAQSPCHHLAAAQHLARNGRDLSRAEIEPLVELLQ